MPKYIVDVNLPYYFKLWNNSMAPVRVPFFGTPQYLFNSIPIYITLIDNFFSKQKLNFINLQ